MTRKASALVHNAHEHVLSQKNLPNSSNFQRSGSYGHAAIQDGFSSADFSAETARAVMPDMSVYGNRQQYIDPVLEQPRGWNQRGHNDHQMIEQGVKIMPERNLAGNSFILTLFRI